MTDQEMLDLMARYRVAFGKADAAGLAAVVTDDFEWHMHDHAPGPVSPTGRVLVGVKAMHEEIVRRQSQWRDVRFDNLERLLEVEGIVDAITYDTIQRPM